MVSDEDDSEDVEVGGTSLLTNFSMDDEHTSNSL
jgi:hypothetical protein